MKALESVCEMKEIEEANSAAVESCRRVLSLVSNSKDEHQFRSLAEQTGDAIHKFRKVVSILNSSCGRARVRKSNKIQPHFPQNLFLDNPIWQTSNHPKPLHLFQANSAEDHPLQESGSTVKSDLTLVNYSVSSRGKDPLHQFQQPSLHNNHFLEQQLQHQRQIYQQNLKQQAELMYCRSNSGVSLNFDSSTCTPSMSSTRSFISSLSIDGSVATGERGVGGLVGAARSADESLYQHKRRCCGREEDGSGKCGSRCHCSRKRKHRVKRSIKVPAVSNKLADIPPDEYTWRKYGQKPIKGSPHPRGYYKCSSMRGCPARKHVEKCLDNPSMMIVTYEGDHNHPKFPSQSSNT